MFSFSLTHESNVGTKRLFIDWLKQTGGSFSRQKKMGRYYTLLSQLGITSIFIKRVELSLQKYVQTTFRGY